MGQMKINVLLFSRESTNPAMKNAIPPVNVCSIANKTKWMKQLEKRNKSLRII